MQAILIKASHHCNFDDLFYKAIIYFTMVCHRASSIRSDYDNNVTWVPTSFTLSLIACMPGLFRKKKKEMKRFETKQKKHFFSFPGNNGCILLSNSLTDLTYFDNV